MGREAYSLEARPIPKEMRGEAKSGVLIAPLVGGICGECVVWLWVSAGADENCAVVRIATYKEGVETIANCLSLSDT